MQVGGSGDFPDWVIAFLYKQDRNMVSYTATQFSCHQYYYLFVFKMHLGT